jgi:hypothetical protein
MSANPALPRPWVTKVSEECADLGVNFSNAARRLLDEHTRLVRFFKANVGQMEGQTSEVALYLLAVVLRIFDRAGGRVGRVGSAEIEAATQRILKEGKALLPFDDGFADRVRGVSWRAQPAILDEALFALFERQNRKDNEVPVEPEQAGRIFLMLWAATEAMDAAWRAPAAAEWKEASDGAA